MGKLETIKQHTPAYLKGRSPEAIAKFKAKSLEKQYSAIMAWRHQQKIKASRLASPMSIVDSMKSASKLLDKFELISAEDLNVIEKSISDLLTQVHERHADLKNAEMRKLMAEKEAIETRLRELNENC